jgi:LytS/YehU family sensor histidine kinase
VVAATLALDARSEEFRQRTASAQLEAKLVGAQLEALQGQLRPHFLFNALNSAIVLVREEPESAETMLLRISDLLRRSLQTDERTLIPLSEELELLELYLGVERVRFADRLLVHVDVPESALPLRVPAWLLQPVVENAIRHGIAPLRKGGNLWIACEVAVLSGGSPDDRWRLTVEDDGPGDGAPTESGAGGLGLANTRERLLAAFGSTAKLRLGPRPGGGTRVEFELPTRSMTGDSGE